MTVKELEEKYALDYCIIYYGKYDNDARPVKEYVKKYSPYCNSSIFPNNKEDFEKMTVVDYEVNERNHETATFVMTKCGIKNKRKEVKKGEVYALVIKGGV